jgi:hypothetical protein
MSLWEQGGHCECHEMGGLTFLMLRSRYPAGLFSSLTRLAWPMTSTKGDYPKHYQNTAIFNGDTLPNPCADSSISPLTSL